MSRHRGIWQWPCYAYELNSLIPSQNFNSLPRIIKFISVQVSNQYQWPSVQRNCACSRMSCEDEGIVDTQAAHPANSKQPYWKGMQLWQASDVHKNTISCCQDQEEQHECELCLGGICPLAPMEAGSQKAEILLPLEHLPQLFLSFVQTSHTHHLQARKTEVIAISLR